jgi:hypothetical protein
VAEWFGRDWNERMNEKRVYVANANGDWFELPEGFTLDLFVLVSPKSVDEFTDGDDFAEIIQNVGQAVSIDLKGLVR